jgi:hypothetical protein
MKTLINKILPNLPLPKGGKLPLFSKEGRGEIFQSMTKFLNILTKNVKNA